MKRPLLRPSRKAGSGYQGPNDPGCAAGPRPNTQRWYGSVTTGASFIVVILRCAAFDAYRRVVGYELAFGVAVSADG